MDTLDAVVTASEDGSRISAAVINKHPDEEKTFTVSFQSAPREYRLITVNGPSKDSFNDLSKTEVVKKEGEWKPAGQKEISVCLEPHSVNILQIRM